MRSRDRLLLPVAGAGGALSGALSDVAGAGHWRAATAGAVTAVVVAVLGHLAVHLPGVRRPRWPAGAAVPRRGARSGPADLAAGIDLRAGRVDPRALADVQRVARRRLRRCGLDLDAPRDRAAVEALVGRPALDVLLARPDVLAARGTDAGPDAAAVSAAVDRLSALAPPEEPAGAVPRAVAGT